MASTEDRPVDRTMWTSLLHAGLAGSFMRFPHVRADTEELKAAGAGAAIYGIPFDATNISRTGSNYGPRGIRDVSVQFLTYNALLDFDVADALSPVDCGDCDVIPGDPQRTFERAQADLEQILRSGALPVTLGGEHSVTIPAVRATKAVVANPGLVLVDTHLDTAPDVGGELLSHCCPITRAVDAGFDPAKIVLVGISGWMNPRTELEYCREHGITVIWLEEIWERGTAVGDRARARGHARRHRRRLPLLRHRLARRRARARHLLPDARRAHQPRGDRARRAASRRRAARRRRRRGRPEPRLVAPDRADGRPDRARGDGLPRRGGRAEAMQALLAQLEPAPGEPAANAARAAELVAAHPDADLVVLPGAVPLTGYDLDARPRDRRRPRRRPSSRPCARPAEAADTALIVGFGERRGERGRERARAASTRAATLAAVYRKLCLFGAEADVFEAGDELVVAELGERRVGPLICFDMEFPEPARALAAAGADLLVTASANMEPFFDDHLIACAGPGARQPAPASLRQPLRRARPASVRRAARARCAPTGPSWPRRRPPARRGTERRRSTEPGTDDARSTTSRRSRAS